VIRIVQKAASWLKLGVAGLLIALLGAGGSVHARHADTDAQRVADWIQSLQFTDPGQPSFGGIRVHHTASAIGKQDGKPYYRVSPYINNLAVSGLLASKAPFRLQVAERWIDWYFRHLTPASAPDGVPYEHFYLQDGSGETVCVVPGDPHLDHYNDATDSAAATFLSLLRDYLRSGGTSTQLRTSEWHKRLEGMADALLRLQQPDGLFWAKASYRTKYLEDNCEVFDGLQALAELERQVYANAERARAAEEAAKRLKQGVQTELYAATGSWRVAKFEDGTIQQADTGRWYPDMQCQMWPHLYSLVAVDAPQTLAVRKTLREKWASNEPGAAHLNWTRDLAKINNGVVNSDVAYAALLLGQRENVEAYLRAFHTLKFPDVPSHHNFDWPFTPLDAGWLLRIYARL